LTHEFLRAIIIVFRKFNLKEVKRASHKTASESTFENMAKATNERLSGIKEILAHYPAKRGSLIPTLQDIQEKFGYLSEETVEVMEQLMGISANEIYGVATFYSQFRFSPPGKHTIRVCEGTACHVRGGQQILKEVEQSLSIKAGERTTDGRFDLERVACLGCCALAPVVVVDSKVHAKMTVKKIPSILSQYGGQKDREGK
jgi:NADH-quinone oxidoreductase E subunit